MRREHIAFFEAGIDTHGRGLFAFEAVPMTIELADDSIEDTAEDHQPIELLAPFS
jgi:hypothetical protein